MQVLIQWLQVGEVALKFVVHLGRVCSERGAGDCGICSHLMLYIC